VFWTKVACDGCERKFKQSALTFYRESYFCSTACRDEWATRNPPRMAKGTPDELRRSLIALVDVILADRAPRNPGDWVVGAVPIVGSVLRQHAAADHLHDTLQTNQYLWECLPILNALGYREQAFVFDTAERGTLFRDALLAAVAAGRERAEREVASLDTDLKG
jgi:hypothetical protein